MLNAIVLSLAIADRLQHTIRTNAVSPPAAALPSDAATEDVSYLYEMLLREPISSRSRQLSALPGATQAAIWARHLTRALAQHPEFSAAQRAVIQEALTVLTPQMFLIDSEDPRWAMQVDMPLRILTQHARALFPLSLAREIFAQLGPDDAVQSMESCTFDQPSQSVRRPVKRLDALPDCSCSSVSDYCGLMFHCVNGGCTWTHHGCGTFFVYGCTGQCTQYP